MNSIFEMDNCNQLLDILSFLLMFISFIAGVIFFSRTKDTKSDLQNDQKQKELIEMEQSFFIDNPKEIFRRNN
jgi:hypothetical protein